MKTKRIVHLSLLFALTGAIIATGYSIKSNVSFADGETCSHVGYHYNYLEETYNTPGHEEFWSCCKCHEAFLEQPKGIFTDADNEDMTGTFDSTHIAYIPNNPILENCYKETINTDAGNIVQYRSVDDTVYTKIGDGKSFLYFKYYDSTLSQFRAANIGVNNPKDEDGKPAFDKYTMLYTQILESNTEEWVRYFNSLDPEIKSKLQIEKHDILIIGAVTYDGIEVHGFKTTRPTIYCELGSLFEYETVCLSYDMYDDLRTEYVILTDTPRDITCVALTTSRLELAFVI